jgi:hypothetical protein
VLRRAFLVAGIPEFDDFIGIAMDGSGSQVLRKEAIRVFQR